MKDFFRVVIKIIGLIILLFDPYGIIINLFSEIFRPDRELYIIAFLFLALFIILLLSFYCIFKTDSIINLLKLNKEFKENIDFINIKADKLLTIAIFIVGGILITYSFSSVLVALIYTIGGFFDENIQLSTSPDIRNNLMLNIIDLILGILIVTNAKRIISLMEQKK